ncbi:MAG TPA: twin-arginine translocation signal domain-containing protein, partial [Thermoguttaceae bacterium]|nr:twin-arginine translocation signal domain-containing protein [Thermoguttaceae bacterium]
MNKKSLARSRLLASKASHQDRQISGFSRRGFLKGAGLLGGTALVTGLARQCHAAERSTIKLALIGCGGRGTGAVADAFAAAAALELGPIKLFAMADIFEHKIQTSYKHLSTGFAAQVDVPP